jgi:hypothetical protein
MTCLVNAAVMFGKAYSKPRGMTIEANRTGYAIHAAFLDNPQATLPGVTGNYRGVNQLADMRFQETPQIHPCGLNGFVHAANGPGTGCLLTSVQIINRFFSASSASLRFIDETYGIL